MNNHTFILANTEKKQSAFFGMIRNNFSRVEFHDGDGDFWGSIHSKFRAQSMEDDGPMVFFVEYPLLEEVSRTLNEKIDPLKYILVSFSAEQISPRADLKNVFIYMKTGEPIQSFNFIMDRIEAESCNKARLASLQYELGKFYEIGRFLSYEKDTIKLLDKIIENSINLTSSDAGTIYLIVDKKDEHWSFIKNNSYEDKLLKFIIAKNMSISVKLEALLSPITPRSIFGYTVISGHSLRIDDVYQISNEVCYQHDHSYDLKIGYRTKSILSIPMKDHNDNIIGIIQLINKKKLKNKVINYADSDALNQIIPYDSADELIMNSLAGQAAVALENNMLYRDMNRLLEEYKQQNSQLVTLSKKILKAHEDERKRVAREIHDGPAQSVVNLSLKSELCRRYLQKKDYSSVEAEIDAISSNARATAKEIRTIIYDLKPSYLEDGLICALKSRIEIFEQSTGIAVFFEASGDDAKVEYYLASAIYNMVQESLTNIQKHACARNVKLSLSISSNKITALIIDDGKGFDPSKPGKKNNSRIEGGFGLEGMHERAELIRGKVTIQTAPGKGTKIMIEIPLVE